MNNLRDAININDFIKKVDKDFWKEITQDSVLKDVIKFNDLDRETFLKHLFYDIKHGHYKVNKPFIIDDPKKYGIKRPVCYLRLEDACIYYYTIRSIEDELLAVVNIHDEVFGGFKSKGRFFKREKEKIEETGIEYEYQPNAFNKFAWLKEWSAFTKLALKTYQSNNYQYFVHVDIANFYDNIDIQLLEKNVRAISNGKGNISDLLFYLLKHLDIFDSYLNINHFGVPQESVGETSRILSQFYLSEYDTKIKSYINRHKLGEFFRFSDDQWFAANSKEDLYKIIGAASRFLREIKLSINTAKIKILNREEYYKYWQFDRYDKLIEINKHVRQNIELSVEEKEYFKNSFSFCLKSCKNGDNARWEGLLKLILTIEANSDNFILTYKSIQTLLLLIETNPLIFIRSGSFPKLVAKFKKKKNFEPLIVDFLKKYILSENNIYPSVEIKLIQLINECDLGKESEEFKKIMLKVLFDTSEDKAIYNWYSKCLALDILSKYNLNREELRKIIKHLKHQIEERNLYLRRSYMHFIYHKDHSPSKLLEFSLPSDLKFIKFLEIL